MLNKVKNRPEPAASYRPACAVLVNQGAAKRGEAGLVSRLDARDLPSVRARPPTEFRASP
ncbi:hypothetical protein DYH55_09005 [Methylovirgula sp. 4M-Z18]|nr:hypothetical protein DYH55_09005 [Methylovirgula sp. 4M-Z18]